MFRFITNLTVVFGLLWPLYSLSNEVNAVEHKTDSVMDKKITKIKLLKSASLNINTASVNELSLGLKSVGKTKAQAIIDYRIKSGKFEKIEDLLKVKGIGTKIIEMNKKNIRLEDK